MEEGRKQKGDYDSEICDGKEDARASIELIGEFCGIEHFFVVVRFEIVFVEYRDAQGNVGVQMSLDELGKDDRACLKLCWR